MRKTPNLLIRDPHRKSIKQAVQPPPSASSTKIQTKQNSNENHHNTVTNTKQQKKSSLRSIPAINQKQLVLAQTLNQYEQMQIQNQVKKAVGKKLRASESKIESDMVGMLEGQCQRLGQQLERQRMCNEKLRSQIEKMRQNIQSLNVKLQKMHQDHNYLSKHQESGKVQNKHLLTQISQLKHNLRSKQIEIQSILNEKEQKIIQKNIQIQKLNSRLQRYQQQVTALRELKQSAENQVEQITKQAEYLRETLEKKKMEWDEIHRQLDSKAKANLTQKSQKISKHQAEILKLQDKLKQEQTLRKKLTQRNKQLEKQSIQKGECKKQLQQIITNYKKRINDLSILKSSNNTILNQKISELQQQNQQLRMQIEILKGNIKPIQISQAEKPVLFGAHDFQ